MTTKTLRYIGTAANPYFESAVTGRPQAWYTGQASDVPTAAADLLLATGLFEQFVRDVGVVISPIAPSDADGRPDGTIYIQTA